MYHGSPTTILAIRPDGVFGGLFAAADAASARSHGAVLHVIRSPHPLDDYALNYEIAGAHEIALELADGNETIADLIMSADCDADSVDRDEVGFSHLDGAEFGWEIQRLRGVLAARLGFTSIEMRDEHGTTWLCLPSCTIEQI